MFRMRRWLIATALTGALFATPAGAAEPVISWEYDQIRPAVAYGDASGVYLAVWEDHHWGFGADWDIYGRRITADGSMLGAEFGIAFEGENARVGPAVAYNRDLDEFLVVFEYAFSASDHDIRAQRVAGNGTLVGPELVISALAAYESRPVVAYNPAAEEYLIVWELRTGTDEFTQHDIYGRRIDPTGAPLGNLIQIDISATDQRAPAVAFNRFTTEYLAVWQDRQTTHFDISGRRIGGNGALLGNTIPVGAWEADQLAPRVAFNHGTDEFLVVWEDHRPGGGDADIYGQRLNDEGALTGASILIAAAGANRRQRPDVACARGTTECVVAWEFEYSVSDHDVYRRRVAGDGTLPDNDAPISNSAAWEGRPAVAADTASAVVWEDARNSSMGLDVYADIVTLPVVPTPTATATPTASIAPSATRTSTRTATPTPTRTGSPVPTVRVSVCATADSHVDQANVQSNYGTAPALYVGYGQGTGEPFARRALARFDIGFIPAASQVVSATFQATLSIAGGVSVVDVRLYPIAGEWGEDTATWANQPGVLDSPATTTPVGSGVPATVTWDVRPLVQRWVEGSLANHGIELRGNESGAPWVRAFDSREAASCPRLIVDVAPSTPFFTPTPPPTFTPTATVTPPCPHPDGAGDTFETAAAIAPDGTTTAEYICPSGDIDWWRFTAAVYQEIDIALYDMPADYDLILTDASHGLLASSEQFGAERDETIRYTTYSGGQFYVGVRPKGVADWNSVTPYRLRVTTRFNCIVPDEAGSTLATSTLIQPSLPQLGALHPIEATICPQGDSDVFRFEVPGGAMQMTVRMSELPADYNLYLFGPNSTIEGSSEQPGTAEELITLTVAEQPGTWWVQVQPAAWEQYHPAPYRLEVSLTSTVDLTVQGMEATQAIQNLQNGVVLISGKPTLVRVYASTTAPAVPAGNVRVKLEGWRLGALGPVEYLGALTAGPQQVRRWTGAHDQRFQFTNSFNFILPQSWQVPQLRLRAEVNPEPAVPETSAANNVFLADVSFTQRAPLNLGLVAVRAQGITPALQNNPQLDAAIAWLRDVWPAYRVNLWYKAGGAIDGDYDYRLPGDGTCGSGWHSILQDLNDIYDDWSNRPQNAKLFGIIDPAVPPGGGTGCGYTPGNVAAALLGTGSNGGPTVAHEVGHNYGRRHAPCGVGDPDANYPAYLSPDGFRYDSGSIGEVGVRVGTGTAFDPITVKDLMSYCAPEWFSPYTWNAIIAATPWPASLRAAATATTPHLVVAGLLGEGTIRTLRPMWIQERTAGSAPGEGSYRVELQDAGGRSLQVRHFDWRPDDPNTPDHFREVVPWDTRTARIVFRYAESLIHIVQVSAHAPVVTVVSPNGGERWDTAGPYTIRWQATDPDGDALSARVAYSPDGGDTWLPVAVNLQATQLQVLASDLPGSTQALVRVVVSDGVNTSEDVSDAPFRVARKPPVPVIVSPADGLVIAAGEPVLLDGTAMDPEDGPLADDALAWTSDIDGALGSGAAVAAEHLSGGTHRITLTATDSDGQHASVTATLFVATPATPVCAGDCDFDAEVTVNELIRGVNIALGTLGVEACFSFDGNGDGEVTIDELIGAVNHALNTCPGM